NATMTVGLFAVLMAVLVRFRVLFGLTDLIHNRNRRWTLAVAQKIFDPVLEILLVQNPENPAYDLSVSVDECGRRETCSQAQALHMSGGCSSPDWKRDLQLLDKRRNLALGSFIVR